MAAVKIGIEYFLQKKKSVPVFDARSPSEYHHAHVPDAVSFPIFNDEERRIIGTAYKQESREKAIKLGLDFFGHKMSGLIEKAETHFREQKISHKEVIVHCWRGGMRSAAVAWLLDLYGFRVYLLDGGYKAYRRWVLLQFERSYKLFIVGGCTGGNKTGVLNVLQKQGNPVIDLEALSGHKGSAFGNLDGVPQPSQEQFENLLAEQLLLHSADDAHPIWVEGESQRLGNVNIPLPFFRMMRNSTLLFLDIPFEERLKHIVEGYGRYPKDKLINGILRIKKRLGGLETKTAINALLEDDVEACFAILLKYYDKLYLRSTFSKELGEREIINVTCEKTEVKTNTDKILNYAKSRQV